jgi:phosphatidylglycerophosphatase A
MRKIVLFVATGAGSGYAPIAPGTAGSAVGLLLYALLVQLPGPGFVLAVAATTLVGIWAAGRAEEEFGKKDDGRITVDEVAGMLVSLVALPVRLDVAVAAFFLFRFFDIAKPPPVRGLERLQGGVGVVADDLVAGLYANIAGQILWRILFPEGLW